MNGTAEHLAVLDHYPEDCQPGAVESLGSAGGFSGAKFWRIKTGNQLLCLRRWPQEAPSRDRLEFIQAVLRHARRQGFRLAPIAQETRTREGYVEHSGYLWELTPWMTGEANFREAASPEKLAAGMAALAEFHRAAATFPGPGPAIGRSPGICRRLEKLRHWLSGDLDDLTGYLAQGPWSELYSLSRRILQAFPSLTGDVLCRLEHGAGQHVPIQPCIGDVWHNHILYEGAKVSGLIDYGAMRWDNVSCDFARLLGSMALDEPDRWRCGMEAYQAIRPLSEVELALVDTFDRSTVLMAGLNWIDWFYRQRRDFENRDAIPGRMAEIADRLERLAER